jgi:hypothetical protein
LLLNQGRRDEAQRIFAMSIDVTPEMAHKLIKVIKYILDIFE